MFGSSYFGARFYPPVYFGEAGADEPIPPVPVPTGGGGPGGFAYYGRDQPHWKIAKTGVAKPRGVAARFTLGDVWASGTVVPADATAYPAGVEAFFALGQCRGAIDVVARARAAPAAARITEDDLALLLLVMQDEDDNDE